MGLPHYGNIENQKSVHVYLQKGQQECSFIDAEDVDVIVLAAYVSHQFDGILDKIEKKTFLMARN